MSFITGKLEMVVPIVAFCCSTSWMVVAISRSWKGGLEYRRPVSIYLTEADMHIIIIKICTRSVKQNSSTEVTIMSFRGHANDHLVKSTCNCLSCSQISHADRPTHM
jgi:hypothetical protein